MKRCIFSSLARTDFRNIHEYIAVHDLDAALDLTTQIQLACENLAKMPEIGRKRDDLIHRKLSLLVFFIGKNTNKLSFQGTNAFTEKFPYRTLPDLLPSRSRRY